MYIIDNFDKFNSNYDPNKNLRLVNFPNQRVIEHFEDEISNNLKPDFKPKAVDNYAEKAEPVNTDIKATVALDPKEELKKEVVVETKGEDRFKPFMFDLVKMLVPLMIIFFLTLKKDSE